jgi:hypothetical protein
MTKLDLRGTPPLPERGLRCGLARCIYLACCICRKAISPVEDASLRRCRRRGRATTTADVSAAGIYSSSELLKRKRSCRRGSPVRVCASREEIPGAERWWVRCFATVTTAVACWVLEALCKRLERASRLVAFVVGWILASGRRPSAAEQGSSLRTGTRATSAILLPVSR